MLLNSFTWEDENNEERSPLQRESSLSAFADFLFHEQAQESCAGFCFNDKSTVKTQAAGDGTSSLKQLFSP